MIEWGGVIDTRASTRSIPRHSVFNFANLLSRQSIGRNTLLDPKVQSAVRKLRRWQQHFLVEIRRNDHGHAQIFVDGKKLLKTSELKEVVKKAYREVKGCGGCGIRRAIGAHSYGISRRYAIKAVRKLPIRQRINPIFDNKAPLTPIRASRVQERHQIDLVDMRLTPAVQHDTVYKFVLSVLDVFSRYIWLRPMQSKSSKEVVKRLKPIYQKEGNPNIIQCDQGTEFKGDFSKFCQQHGIKLIRSSPYHPHSQGKIERSHAAWKRKLYYDRQRSPNCNWASRLQTYANIVNSAMHRSIGLSPFEVYYARSVNPSITSTLDSDLRHHFATATTLRRRVNQSTRASEQDMIRRYGKKHKPTLYFPNDRVFVRAKRKPGLLRRQMPEQGVIVKANHVKHVYVVRFHDNCERVVRVSDIAAHTRDVDIQRRLVSSETGSDRLCSDKSCKREKDGLCSYNFCRKCCAGKRQKCINPLHCRINIRDFTISTTSSPINAFVAAINAMEKTSSSSSSPFGLMSRNAVQYDLYPVGETPRDGHCMFHAVAESLNKLDGTTLSYRDIRIAVANWLRRNPTLPNDVYLPDFVANMHWNDYVDGMADHLWGDHLALIAITHIYDVAVGVISSSSRELRFLETTQTREGRIIFLGHESEVHYHRLEQLTDVDNSCLSQDVSSIKSSFVAINNRNVIKSGNRPIIASDANSSSECQMTSTARLSDSNSNDDFVFLSSKHKKAKFPVSSDVSDSSVEPEEETQDVKSPANNDVTTDHKTVDSDSNSESNTISYNPNETNLNVDTDCNASSPVFEGHYNEHLYNTEAPDNNDDDNSSTASPIFDAQFNGQNSMEHNSSEARMVDDKPNVTNGNSVGHTTTSIRDVPAEIQQMIFDHATASPYVATIGAIKEAMSDTSDFHGIPYDLQRLLHIRLNI